MSKCTIGLLLSAAHIAYRIVGEDSTLREEPRVGYVTTAELTSEIDNSGYKITEKTNVDAEHSNGLNAARLEPLDDKSPIIISFRGTDSFRDLLSDLHLTLTGRVEKKLRNEAYKFYTDTKERFPDREIVLVGHSLGGHLAQYVGAKAYGNDILLRQSRSLHVRTFNTAPLNTANGRWLQTAYPGVFGQFCNYRLDSDIVSRTPVQQYYGNTFSFICEKSRLDAHPLRSMRETLPFEIKNLEIGGKSKPERDLNTLKEAVMGIKDAYAAHVKGQWFSKYRMGAKNNKIIEKALSEVTKALNEIPPEFQTATLILEVAQKNTSGRVSNNCLDCLLKDVNFVKAEYQSEVSKLPSDEVQESQEVNSLRLM